MVEAQQDESSSDGGDAQPAQQLWGSHTSMSREIEPATGAPQLEPTYRVKNKVPSVAVRAALVLLALAGVPSFRRGVVVQVENSHGQNSDSPVDAFHPAETAILHVTAVGAWRRGGAWLASEGHSGSFCSDGDVQVLAPALLLDLSLVL